MKIYQAPDTPDSYVTVVRLRRNAQQWLATTGTDQWANDWPDTETMLAGFTRRLRNGETWFAADDDGRVLGAVVLNHETDPGLWTEDEQTSALFIHRLTVDRAATGKGVGAALLNFANDRARSEGKSWLRLDAWTTNTALHRYYKRQGFRLVRIAPDHHTPSAACFERPV